MENIVHTTSRIEDAHVIAYITDIEFQLRTGEALAHIILLFLVTTENTDFSDVGIQKALEDGVAEGAGAAGDEEGFSIKNRIMHYIFHLTVCL